MAFHVSLVRGRATELSTLTAEDATPRFVVDSSQRLVRVDEYARGDEGGRPDLSDSSDDPCACPLCAFYRPKAAKVDARVRRALARRQG